MGKAKKNAKGKKTLGLKDLSAKPKGGAAVKGGAVQKVREGWCPRVASACSRTLPG